MASIVQYNDDFYAWSQEQAALLEAQRFADLDIANLVEEIAALGRSERHAVGSHLTILLLHLLTWHYQPERRQTGHSWRASITHARDEIAAFLEDSPSLQRQVPDLVARRYAAARRQACDETGLAIATFPAQCPWRIDQLLNADFFPEP